MAQLQPYLVSLFVGLAIGVIYGLVSVRSPAPPIVALLGLLGMLAHHGADDAAKKGDVA
jgi:XapX domain-containing protein